MPSNANAAKISFVQSRKLEEIDADYIKIVHNKDLLDDAPHKYNELVIDLPRSSPPNLMLCCPIR